MANQGKHSGYVALRRGRWSESNRIYLLTTVAEGRRKLFADWQSASIAASVISHPKRWPGANLLCWVLMPDHWHGLIELTGNTRLADAIRVAKGRSARAVNSVLQRTGPVWMPGFHDRALRRDENVADAARYIIANPLRAGLVTRVGDYPYWNAVWLPQ